MKTETYTCVTCGKTETEKLEVHGYVFCEKCYSRIVREIHDTMSYIRDEVNDGTYFDEDED